jgi:hypothetical protein
MASSYLKKARVPKILWCVIEAAIPEKYQIGKDHPR